MNIEEINDLFEPEEKETFEMTVVNGELKANERALTLFEEARELKRIINDAKARLDEIEKPLKKAVIGNKAKYSGDILSATYVKASTVEQVNIEKMKQDGIYDKYKVLVPRDEYAKVTYKGIKK